MSAQTLGEATLVILYNIADPVELQRVQRHCGYWGRRFTDVIVSDDGSRALLIYRPSPDARWRPWEQVRRDWILKDLLKGPTSGERSVTLHSIKLDFLRDGVNVRVAYSRKEDGPNPGTKARRREVHELARPYFGGQVSSRQGR